MRILFLCIVFASSLSHARVFNINEADIASYFRGSFGNSAIAKHPYEKSSGAQTVFTEGSDFNYSGEFGIVFPSKNYSFRVGIMFLHPQSPSELQGKDGSGTVLMNIDSSVLGVYPMAHLEYYVSRNAYGRVYFSVGGGYGRVTLTNDYTMTTDGTTLYSVNSFKEKSSQYTYIVESSIGYETSFVQAVTVTFDLGYRYSVARSLKYDTDSPNFSGGTNSSGDPVLNSDGHSKTLDLSGVFAGLSFRFYFN